MKNTTLKKTAKIIGNIVMYFFLFLCIVAILITVFSKKGLDGGTEVFGYQMRVVTTDSMGKCDATDVSSYDIKSIPVNSMVFVKVMPTDPEEADDWYRSIKKGDVLTFRYVYSNQITITHRVVDIVEKETGGFLIYLEGDNKNSDSDLLEQVIDTSIPNNTNYVIGKVTGQSYILGLFLTILKNPIGTICLVIVPCFVIILLEVLKIVKILNEDKKKQEKEELTKKDNELEELRKKIAELEKAQADKGEASAD